MNKLGKRDYVMLIADALVEEYGGGLKEHGTDVKMAENVLETLRMYLYFHPMDASKKEFEDWKKKRDNQNDEYEG